MQHARPDASPGLMRRRYSVPETIMRKYRLAQRADADGSAPPSPRAPASAEPAPRALRRDRELMRKSALLRRMWARTDTRACCCCTDTRSLDASRCDLAPPPPAPADTPKRQRLTPPSDERLTPPSDERLTSPSDEYLAGGTHTARTHGTSSDACSPPPRPAPGLRPTCELVLPTRRSSQDIHEHSTERLSPYTAPLAVDAAHSYDVLEIVVSETLDVAPDSAVDADGPASDKLHPNGVKLPPYSQRSPRDINIDEYVSNILVESLNSLTDQLECMNASIASDRRISIVEKEIKVRLQNTGVNTIVHLSPTSNNQIIFGNEELCNDRACRDACDYNALIIREEALSVESNNNLTSAEPALRSRDSFDIHHDDVNRAVLQQIQKLFQDEIQNLSPGRRPSGSAAEISHIEASDVDVYMENARHGEPIGGVGAGNYFPEGGHSRLVPRFSALPHTDSMEVNTSSSDDADFIGSDCTSLVDSLDDPNSPRSILMRRTYGNKRGELVRSAIDVLDLLPENVRDENTPPPRDKPESFFIGIKDDESECDKENVNVADRMPEKIKQRLYRRHRTREQRMHSARRTRSGAPRPHEARRARDAALQRDCAALLQALLDDVIAKIVHDEYKCMRLKHRPARTPASKSDNLINNTKRSRRKDSVLTDNREPVKGIKNGSPRLEAKEKHDRHQIYGKLSLRTSSATDDRAAKRIYQKSEIHEGNKCIEILEILEYVDGSQSSPEAVTSDENQNLCMKNKKSRIPILIPERALKSPGVDNRRWPASNSRGADTNGNTNRSIASMLLEALADRDRSPASRRSSVPAPSEPRERANSLRFRRVFDVIPEERSSLSLDSGPEEAAHNRRASAPDIVDEYCEPPDRDCDAAPPDRAQRTAVSPPNNCARNVKETCSVATSPMSDRDAGRRAPLSRHQTTMTSPSTAPPRPRYPPSLPGGWSVTVAGGCAALPPDVDMRLRFPRPAPPRPSPPRQECWCRHCATCSCGAPPAPPAPRAPPALPAAPPAPRADPRLTLTVKKEALDSSILASKSSRKSSAQLPEVETYHASRSKLKSTVKAVVSGAPGELPALLGAAGRRAHQEA